VQLAGVKLNGDETVNLPLESWPGEQERALVTGLLAALAGRPVALTDGLANTLWFSPEAESLFGERAEAIVNRVAFSLLGFGKNDRLPPGLKEALLGEGPAWRGIVKPEGRGEQTFLEASCIQQNGRLLCGVLRFGNGSSDLP
jgi:hypothetical protein